MLVQYLPIDFYIHFDTSVIVDNNILYILRGVLGNNLRKMCCLTDSIDCISCLYNCKCFYSKFFEAIQEKKLLQFQGGEKLSSPFCFSYGDDISLWSSIQDFHFTLTVFGDYINYIPYIYKAFIMAGKKGIFRNRVPFVITDVIVNNVSILKEDGTISSAIKGQTFSSDDFSNEYCNEKYKVSLLSPLRFLVDKEYVTDLNALDFLKCLNRRYITLSSLYGNCEQDYFEYSETKLKITDKNYRWINSWRYSGRQKKKMNFGGIKGEFFLEGEFSPLEKQALYFAQIANAGKNTNFGAGQIRITKVV